MGLNVGIRAKLLMLKRFAGLGVAAGVLSTAYTNCSGGFQVQQQASLNSLAGTPDPKVTLNFSSTQPEVMNDSNSTVNFSVISTNSDYILKCTLNNADSVPCNGSTDLKTAPEGDSVFSVQATNKNGYSLASISRVFRIDRKAPVIAVTSAPASTISTAAASVVFSVTDNYSTASEIKTECALDATTFAVCSSPLNYSNLAAGAHVIKLRATDKANNVSPVTSLNFTVNLNVSLPVVAISQSPGAYINTGTASLSFQGTSSGSTISGYECSLDNGATFSACTSPKSYTGLTDGSYDFAVRAKDANNQTSSLAKARFTVDTVAPTAPAVSSNLTSPSNQTSLSLAFSSTDASGITGYQCSQDGAAFASCASPKSVTALTSGVHTFKVKATDQAGNTSAEGSYSVTIALDAPAVNITAMPANPTMDTTANFTFTATSSAGVKLTECLLDTESSYSTCSSPKAYSGVAVGNRTFSLRVTDKAGNSTSKTYSWTVAAMATPTPAPPTVPVTTGGIFDQNGVFSPTAYRSIASQIALPAGIEFRYGTPSTASVTTQVGTATDTYFSASAVYGTTVSYQVGSYTSDPGDYSSNHGQYAFVPDDATKYVGIGTLEFLAQRNNTFSEKPQPSWVLPDPDVTMAKTGTTEYYSAGAPAAMGRCYGATCAQAVIAFANGTIGVFGGNTTPTRTSIKLDAGKVPTAVAVTNGNEFALISVWDTINLKGQVAVVALASSKYHLDWDTDHPGLYNFGTYDFMKVIGYIDLPGMVAPTEISAVSGVIPEVYHRFYKPIGGGSCGGDFVMQNEMSLDVEANRQTMMPGGCNYDTHAHGGMAVVISKAESKAIFLDLKPLFAYYESMYFGSLANYTATKTQGQAAAQWPYAFSVASSQIPTIIKTVDLGKRPTAVRLSLWTTQRAWIATEDGTLQIYSIGNYQNGVGAASSSDIALKGSVAIGKNPTSLAYNKDDPAGGDPMIDSLVVVSRAESKIQWVSFSSDRNSGTIRRSLQDSRLKDPVWAESNDAHGTSNFLVTIADYSGKQVSNYRFGPVIFWSNSGAGAACQAPVGCPVAGGGQYEFAGSFTPAGRVFQVTGGNTP